MRRWTLALLVAGIGVALAAALLLRQSGGLGGERVEVPDATAAVLDTVSVQGRHVEASVNGWVVEVGRDGEVWVTSGADAFPLRFPEEVELEVEDHVLATGRLRAWRGRRWIVVTSWAHIRTQVAAPPDPGL